MSSLYFGKATAQASEAFIKRFGAEDAELYRQTLEKRIPHTYSSDHYTSQDLTLTMDVEKRTVFLKAQQGELNVNVPKGFPINPMRILSGFVGMLLGAIAFPITGGASGGFTKDMALMMVTGESMDDFINSSMRKLETTLPQPQWISKAPVETPETPEPSEPVNPQ